MVMRNIVQYRKQAYTKKGLFVYLGTAALKKGYGMCFDLDYLTTTVGELAADAFGARGLKVVEVPSASNNMAFAGVLTQDYPARASGLQLVELYLPGGCAMAAGIIPTTINSTRLTCIVPSALQATALTIANAGLFGRAALPGRGTAISLQTRTNAAATPWAAYYAGEAAYATATGTITCTGAFTYALAGDKVIVLSGDIANAALAGTYYILTRTDANNAIVALTPGGAAFLTLAANGAKLCICVIPAGAPLSLVYLCDGEESGLQEFDVPVSSAVTCPMVGGTTNLLGNVTLAVAHTPPIVDGLFPGMLKLVRLGGTLTTGFYIITPVSLGIAPDGTIAVTVTLAATLGMGLLRWTGQKWDIISVDVAATST